jgi:glutathione S-transferase
MIALHDYELSSNCYKVRLLAGFLGLPLRRIAVDVYPGAQHRSPEFLAINPLGEVPVMDDGGLVLREAEAILVYLAGRYDPTRLWYALDNPVALGGVTQWLALAARLAATVGRARLHDAMFLAADIDTCRTEAHALLRIMDEHLWFAEQEGHEWLCSHTHPTIADVACFPDVMLAEEGAISRLAYPSLRRWTDRVKHIPKFQLMPGIFP